MKSTLKLHAKVKVVEICQKYNNPSSLDKVGQANIMLDEVLLILNSAQVRYNIEHKQIDDKPVKFVRPSRQNDNTNM